MPKSSKHPSKPTSTAASPNPTLPTSPSPFIPASPTLHPFLSTLSLTHIYITHIDTHPTHHKRTIFLVPLALNTVLALGLLYRAYIALPVYYSILVATLGYDSPEKVGFRGAGWGGLMERMGLFVLDYVLWGVVGGWPWEFFVGRKGEGFGPVGWRWRVGWREREVVVRRSRGWDWVLRAGSGEDGGRKGEDGGGGGMKEWASNGDRIERDEEGVMRERIMPAVAPAVAKRKTGYAMLDKSWDLDFGAMVQAHELVSDASSSSSASKSRPTATATSTTAANAPLTINAFRTTVLIHEQGKGWLAWPVHELEESHGGKHEAQRRKIVLMKDRLTAAGKESLFFAWVEMVQFESSSAEGGAFTAERQQKAVRKARTMFEAQGVGFEEFWGEIEGGVEGMMGMEVVE